MTDTADKPILSARKWYTPGWKDSDGNVMIYLADDTTFEVQDLAAQLQHVCAPMMSSRSDLSPAGIIEVAEDMRQQYYINHIWLERGSTKVMCVAGPLFEQKLEKALLH